MAKLPLASFILFTLGISLSFSSNGPDIIYFFPLNDSTTIAVVVKNGSTFTDLGPFPIRGSLSTVEGPDPSQSDQAVNFGSDNGIDFGDYSGTCISDPGLCSSGMTVAFWVRLDAGGSRDMFMIDTGPITWSRGIQFYYTPRYSSATLLDDKNIYVENMTDLIPAGYWTHLVAVYNPTASTATDRFFVCVNGIQKSTTIVARERIFADSRTNLLIGSYNKDAPSNGRVVALSQLTFFFRSLNQTEVQQIYSNPSSGIIQLIYPEPSTTTTSPTTTAATGTTSGASTVAPTTGSASNTSAAAETTSSSSGGGATPSPESSGSPSEQGQEKDGKSRSTTVLILLSISLFLLVVIVIILIISYCILASR